MSLARLALPLVTGTLVAACGSSSTTSTGSNSGGGASSAATAAASSGAVASGNGCDKLVNFGQAFAAQSQKLLSGAAAAQSNPQAFQKQLSDVYKSMAAAMRDLASSAPDELKSDIQYISGAIDQLGQAVDQSGGDFTKLGQAFAPIASQKRFTDAVTHLSTYAATNCGVRIPTAPAAPSFAVPSYAIPTP